MSVMSIFIFGLSACQQTVVTPQTPNLSPVNIWIEAEDAFASSFAPGANPTTAPLSTDVSGERWLEHRGSGAAMARMSIKVPADDAYRLYVRLTDGAVGFSWRIVPLSMAEAREEWESLQYMSPVERTWLEDERRDLLWVDAGRMELGAGSYILEVRLDSKSDAGAALDCFLLTNRRFLPDGPTRPAERKYNAEAGTWPFLPPAYYGDNSVIDLRNLNHRRAGEHGFLKRRGEDFVFEKDEKPTRFFGVNVGSKALLRPDEEIDSMAEMLARRGVNLVQVTINYERFAGAAVPDNYDLDRLHYAFDSFKQSGIYTAVSLCASVKTDGDNEPHAGLLFFEKAVQEQYLGVARLIFRTPNPYALPDTAIADDPALAYVQMFNDTLFASEFNTDSISRETLLPLEQKYFDWVVEKYELSESALDAWGGALAADDVENERLGLMTYSVMLDHDERTSIKHSKQRSSDQVRFFTEIMRDFYINTKFWFEYEIGLRCPVVASSEPTVDAMRLGPLDRYAAMSCDALSGEFSVAGFTRLQREGKLTPGDLYKPRRHLETLYALRTLQYADYPMVLSKVEWPGPNPYRAEGPLFSAAYSALQGVDALIFGDLSHHDWAMSLSADTIATPSLLGQFPAAALLFRRGDVAEATIVARQTLNLESLYELKGTGIDEPTAPDPLRFENEYRSEPLVSSIDPYAFYVGRVQRLFGEFHDLIQASGLADHVDRNAGLIPSIDGQCLINYKQGLCMIDTPMTQAVLGNLNRVRTNSLSTLMVESKNPYGAVTATALDGLPLDRSQSILVQVSTLEMNYDYRASEDETSGYHRIEDVGATPVNVQNASGKVAIRRSDREMMSAIVLDANGNPSIGVNGKRVRSTRVQDLLVIELEPDVMYYHILPSKQVKY